MFNPIDCHDDHDVHVHVHDVHDYGDHDDYFVHDFHDARDVRGAHDDLGNLDVGMLHDCNDFHDDVRCVCDELQFNMENTFSMFELLLAN